jgi:hypothetical protein
MSHDSIEQQLQLRRSRFNYLLLDLARFLSPDAAPMLIERRTCHFDGVAVQFGFNELNALLGLYIHVCL